MCVVLFIGALRRVWRCKDELLLWVPAPIAPEPAEVGGVPSVVCSAVAPGRLVHGGGLGRVCV